MIEYVIGDATEPQGDGNKIIAHCCNDIGAWGAGFVMALSRKWKEPENKYRAWSNGRLGSNQVDDIEVPAPYRLGQMILVPVEEDIQVANMIAQEGVGWKDGIPPIRYDALEVCLATLAFLHARRLNASVHMPRIGCGLAGGTWDKVELLIEKHLPDIRVVVYDLETVK